MKNKIQILAPLLLLLYAAVLAFAGEDEADTPEPSAVCHQCHAGMKQVPE